MRPGLTIPAGELRETASRAGGPGGQHVNKASTRVTLRWCIAESAALSEAQRARLALRLAGRLSRDGELAVRRPRRATAPTRGSRERRLAQKRRRAVSKRERGAPRGEEG